LLTDGTRNFGYDDENQLISVWQVSAWSNNFVYDGKMRRRIERDFAWNGSAWTQTNEIRFVYDGNLVIQERDLNNQPQGTYTRCKDLSGSLQGAGGIGGLLARSDRAQSIPGMVTSGGVSEFGTPSYYHADGNGNITMLIAASQMIVAKYLYDPFGNTLARSGLLADVNNYRFSSKEWNGNSGLYYYLYRYYDPNLQRWVNRDPFLDEGFGAVQMGFYLEQVLFRYIKPNRFLVDQNLYDFVGNDPADEYDYLGLRPGGGPYGPRPSGPPGTPPKHLPGKPGNPCPSIQCIASGGKWQTPAQHDYNGSTDACIDACMGHWQGIMGVGLIGCVSAPAGLCALVGWLGGCVNNCATPQCYH
jgi:RHS repeat-associated protein